MSNPDTKQLIPGSVRGFRLWYLTSEFKLHSINTDCVWQPGINTAKCTKMFVVDHNSPDEGCTCGMYAKYKYSTLQVELRGMLHLIDEITIVVGAIQATGLIVQGRKGFRAEKARVLAICPLSNLYSPEQIENTIYAAREHGVRWYSTMTSLIKDFPEEDIDFPEEEEARKFLDDVKKQLQKDVVISGLPSTLTINSASGGNANVYYVNTAGNNPLNPPIHLNESAWLHYQQIPKTPFNFGA